MWARSHDRQPTERYLRKARQMVPENERIAELEAALTEIRDLLPIEQDSYSSMRRIDVKASLYDLDDLPVQEVVAWAQAILDQVPVEFRQSCTLDFDPGGYDYSPSLTAYYERPETDAERQAREKETEEYAARDLAREFVQFERLKSKFEKSE